jgi:hypothetical protein
MSKDAAISRNLRRLIGSNKTRGDLIVGVGSRTNQFSSWNDSTITPISDLMTFSYVRPTTTVCSVNATRFVAETVRVCEYVMTLLERAWRGISLTIA